MHIAHSKPYVGDTEARAAAAVIRSGQLAQGRQTELLEGELAAVVGRQYGVAVSSGTAALYCALKALRVGVGDTVVVPSYACTALLNAVYATGAQPKLADVDAASGNMTVDTARKTMSKNVKAIIVPHLFGCPAEARQIERACGVSVVEDCAQCVGASIDERKVGSLTTVSVFSFYATKVLAAGEGGMVVSAGRDVAQRVRNIREYDKRTTYCPRFNYKISDIHAAIAREQVKKIDDIVGRRRAIADKYRIGLADAVPKDAFPVLAPGSSPMYYRFVIKKKSGSAKLINTLRQAGIECGRPVFKPLHQYLHLNGFPGTDAFFRSAISLPIYPDLTDTQIQYIINILRDAY